MNRLKFFHTGNGMAAVLLLFWVVPALAGAPTGPFCRHIAVDQFGYLPDMEKVAVISDPKVGFNAADHFTPSNSIEVRAWDSQAVVFSGPPVPWKHGAVHDQSGDKVWWFDFSAVTNRGEYFVYDPGRHARSARFRIADDVYLEALKQATRMYYYQRRGTAKVVPFADTRWTDPTNFMGPLQDTHCRLVTDPSAASERDLRGGWFDAGDYNKYVNFTVSPVSDLLFAYRQNPGIWGDDWGLPESGNGVPDLLDEVKWELDWLLRMQTSSGGVLSKVGIHDFRNTSPPSAEHSQVFYGAASTTATLTAAGNFAQASPLYRSVGQGTFASVLSNAAVRAYAWAAANPKMIFSNSGFTSADPEVDRNNYAYDRDMLRLRAAVFLYDLTGQRTYRDYVESNYGRSHAIADGYWSLYETPVEDALLYYATLPGVDAAVGNRIRRSARKAIGGANHLGAWNSGRDAYRAFMVDDSYHWGSSSVKCRAGTLLAEELVFELDSSRTNSARNAAAGYVHYMHGVNPLALVYLSNMYRFGVESSVNELYHSWFCSGSIYQNALTSPSGPPPGYVPGGANKNFRPDPDYLGPRLAPPMDQPPQKSYKDWGAGWPQKSWEITEPGIYYQSAYVFLLSHFVRR